MKLAHLILAHNKPHQLLLLVNRLSHKNADIYIHLDLKTDIAHFQALKSLPNVFFVNDRESVVWGEYSIIQATLNGMSEILNSGMRYSHINLLSGLDYPLKTASDIQNFLFARANQNFMWYDRIFNDWVHGQKRMNTYYLGDYRFPGRYHIAALLNKALPARRLPNRLTAYGRAQWVTLTTDCVAFVLKYINDNRALQRYFKMTWAVDEVFFQTIICNSEWKDTVVNDNLRYVVLKPDFRPATFTIQDGAALLASGKCYARKFDMDVDSEILSFIDAALTKTTPLSALTER
jgi:Core-2/I-Branching enzyme